MRRQNLAQFQFELNITRLAVLGCLLLGALSADGWSYEALRGPTELRYLDESKAYPGYTLFAAQGTTYLVDLRGKVAHTWPGGANPRLLDSGNLLDATTDDAGNFTGLKELDWGGTAVWTYKETRSAYSPHGDFVRIYNPKLKAYTTLYIANKSVTHAQAIAAGCDPANGPYDGAQVDAIVEVDAGGNVVWEWWFFDHAVQDVDSTKANHVGTGKTIASYPGKIDVNLPGRPLRADWLDCNSIDYNESLDQIVICATRGEFYVIDHGNTFVVGDPVASIAAAAGTAGDFLYRFGDPARYEQGTSPSVSQNWDNSSTGQKQIGGAHNVQWIRSGLTGAGHFLVVDNGQYLLVRTAQSSIVEIDGFLNSSGTDTGQYVNPPTAGYNTVSYNKDTHKGSRQISKQVVWSYASLSNQGFFSHEGSSCQRLPNGNTLVCATTEGLMFEVTSAGSVVWEYLCPVTAQGVCKVLSDNYPMTNAVPRAYRYGLDYPGLAGRDLTTTDTIAALATTMYFPWLEYSPGLTTVGIGFATSDTEPAWADLTAFDTSGNDLGTPCLTELPSQGQEARQAEEMLELGSAAGGWMKAETSASGIRGFFLAQLFVDGELAGLDGAPAMAATTADGIIPRVRTTGGFTTRLALANPGDSAVTVTITGADGSATLDGGTHIVPAHGGVYIEAGSLFGGTLFDGCLRLKSTGGIVASAMVRYGDASISVQNLAPVSQASSRLYAAHITRFSGFFVTEVDLVNPGETEAVVTLTPRWTDGSAMGDPFVVSVPAGQVLTLSDGELGLPGTDNADGWLQVDCAGGTSLVGCVTFGHPLDRRYESTLPLQANGESEVCFAHVANGTVGGVDFFTGLALVNPSSTAVTITIQVRLSDGTLNGTAMTRALAPGEKYVRMLSQLEGVGDLSDQAGGSLNVTATGPVLAFELFGDGAGRFLSAVPAQ